MQLDAWDISLSKSESQIITRNSCEMTEGRMVGGKCLSDICRAWEIQWETYISVHFLE